MNAAKIVQILLVVVAVLFALSVAVGTRGGRNQMEADSFEPPAWMDVMDRITAPFSPKLEPGDLRLEGGPMPNPLTITGRTTLTVLPSDDQGRKARFTVEGDPVRITYLADAPADLDEDARRQEWPNEEDRAGPAEFSILKGGGTITIEPRGTASDNRTTLTLEQ